MKLQKVTTIALTAMFLLTPCFSQSESNGKHYQDDVYYAPNTNQKSKKPTQQELSFEPGVEYKLLRITNDKGEIIQAKNARLDDEKIYFSMNVNERTIQTNVNMSNVKKVELPVGHMAKKGGLIGGAIGGGIGLTALIVKEISIAREEAEYGYDVTDGEARYLMPVAGFAVGYGIGALVGKSKKIYGVAYQSKNTSYKNEFKIEPICMNNYQGIFPGIRLSIKF